jgi:predicted acetyltransferase
VNPLAIRLMRAGDDIAAELDLRHRAFGPMDAAELRYWTAEVRATIAEGRQFGVWDGGRLIGAARYHDMRQWWHGAALPMAGVAGVKVAPEVRGRGVGRALMRDLLAEVARRGYPLATLYPATAQVYRLVGFETAGGHYRIEVPCRSLLRLLPPDPQLPAGPAAGSAAGPAAGPGLDGIGPAIRRAGPEDAEQVIAVQGAVAAAAGDCGPATFDVASSRRWLAGSDRFAYLADDGFLAYGWAGGGHEAIYVEYLQAGSAATARALWGIVASHASVTEVVHATVGPADPVRWLTAEPDVRLRLHKSWMLRLIDARAAIAGRGFPAGADVSVPLLLGDAELPANAGPATLHVRDGAGELRAGGPGAAPHAAGQPLRLGARGFAALYAGTPMATLRLAGLAAGGDRGGDAALDQAFRAEPYLLDYF